jgi:hypothetical protein
MYPVVDLGPLFTELPWPERFAAAVSAGFGRVEFPWPPLPPEQVVRRVRDAGVRVELMNMDVGDLAAGDRGYGHDPLPIPRWRLRLEQALDLAAELGCPLVDVLTGRPGPARGEQPSCLTGDLRRAAGLAAHRGRTLVVEPINDGDVPGYLLPRVSDVLGLIDRVGHEAAGLRRLPRGRDGRGPGDRRRRGPRPDPPRPGGRLPRPPRARPAALDAGGLGLEYVPTEPSAASLRAVTARDPLPNPDRERAS